MAERTGKKVARVGLDRGSRGGRWAPIPASITPDPHHRLTQGFAPTEHLAADAVVAYVDGVLGGTAAARANAHLRDCAQCAADVDAQAKARRALRSTGDRVPLPPGLLGQLSAIPTREIDMRAVFARGHADRTGDAQRRNRDS